MEIQTFFLAKQIEKGGQGSYYNAELVGAHNFFPITGGFPLSFNMPYFLLLRRATREEDDEVTLRFNLIDLDGNEIGKLKNVVAKGVFPKGHKFMVLSGTIELLFPKPGDYSLRIVADKEKLPSEFTYDIEVVEAK